MSQKTKILAVTSMLIGYGKVSESYMNALWQEESFDVCHLPITEDDYTTYRKVRHARYSDAQDIADVAAAKFQDKVDFDYDLLFINGHEIALGFVQEIQSHKTIIGLDSIPALTHSQVRALQPNLFVKLRSHVAEIYTGRAFQKPFQQTQKFFPLCQWCADGLEDVYDIPKEKIRVFYTPTDLEQWQPRDNSQNAKFELLFVGNHFLRKGGDELLNFFKNGKLSSEEYTLTIVSNDPYLDGIKEIPGVRFLKNIPHEDIGELFIRSNLFVFPTKKEYLGNVTTESLSAGVPVLARDVGGLSEYVVDGHSGYLMPFDSPEDAWIEKIKYLNTHRDVCEEFGRNGRQIAEKHFNLKTFNQEVVAEVKSVIER